MQNAISAGNSVSLPAPYVVAGGGGALIGPGLFGVAATALASGQLGAFALTGVFRLAKATGAITVGAKLYWDNTSRVLTTTASGNTYVASATVAAASSDTTVAARLTGCAI